MRFIFIAGQGSYRSVPNSPTRSRSVPFMSNYGQHMQQYPSGLRHSQSRFGKQGNLFINYLLLAIINHDMYQVCFLY